MSTDNNPFAATGGQYAANVSFGAAADAASAKPDLVRDTTTQRFSADVIEESRNQVVLVDFWAPWCGPCKQLTPVLEKVVKAANGRVKLVKMNIDDHPAVAGQLGIQSIPAVIAFKNGQPVDGFMGALPESKVNEFIERVAGPAGPGAQIEGALAAAAEALAGGDALTASDIYQEVLTVAPDNLPAIVGLAGLLVDAGDLEAAGSVLSTVPAEKQGDVSVAGIAARIALAEQAASLGDAADLVRRVEANPKDHEARLDLAMYHNARGERNEAADCLLAIMKADRGWNDDGARKQLLQFFEAWGMTDEATLAARRKLSSLLFS
jgi:putative thioredoxin